MLKEIEEEMNKYLYKNIIYIFPLLHTKKEVTIKLIYPKG